MDKEENQEKLDKIIKYTNYSLLVAKEKLKEFNGNVEYVIKDYYGIQLHKKEKIDSVNQEIYKQIRKKLDIAHYRNSNPINIEDVRQRFIEEDLKKNKNI